MRRAASTTVALLLATVAAGGEPSPPPAADAALLASMRDTYVRLTGERGQARKVLGALNAARYDGQLATLAQGQGPNAPRATGARVRLVSTWNRLFDAVGGPQPVDARAGCRHQEQTLREAMAGAAGSAAAARLQEARVEAQACLDRLSASLEQTRARGRELDAAVAEAKALLATPTEAGK